MTPRRWLLTLMACPICVITVLIACGTHSLDVIGAPLDAAPSDALALDTTTSEVAPSDAIASDAAPSDAVTSEASDADASDAVAPDPLSQDLLAHYTFDEGAEASTITDAGVIVPDHSINGHDGLLTGGTWVPQGKFGGALRMGGADFVIVYPFPKATANFSVSAWVRSMNSPINPDPLETVLSTEIALVAGWELNLRKTDAGMGTHFAYWDSLLTGDAAARPDAAGGYVVSEFTGLPQNQWIHIVGVVDGTNQSLRLYVNGVSVNTQSAPRPISQGTNTLYMGKWSLGGRFLVGDIDDVAIYSRALTQANVTDLGTRSPPDPM